MVQGWRHDQKWFCCYPEASPFATFGSILVLTHLNAHSGISTVKMKTMDEQITTKMLMYRINQMRYVIVEQDYKSLESNLY